MYGGGYPSRDYTKNYNDKNLKARGTEITYYALNISDAATAAQ